MFYANQILVAESGGYMNYKKGAVKKVSCCGCEACAAVCPKGAISIIEDKEGFLYPKIDINSCVKCGRCSNVCAFDSDYCNSQPIYDFDFTIPITYGCKTISESIRASSRSGGVFTVLSDWILLNGGGSIWL